MFLWTQHKKADLLSLFISSKAHSSIIYLSNILVHSYVPIATNSAALALRTAKEIVIFFMYMILHYTHYKLGHSLARL
jgi:hypothetical protein